MLTRFKAEETHAQIAALLDESIPETFPKRSIARRGQPSYRRVMKALIEKGSWFAKAALGLASLPNCYPAELKEASESAGPRQRRV